MKKFLALTFFFILLIGVVSCQYCGPWIPLDWRTIPPALPSDPIQVRYVAAPLLFCSYENDLAYINGYHGGLAFINLRNNVSYTLNFDAYPTFTGVFFPSLQRLDNGTFELEWENYGKTFLYEGINETYWCSLNQYVADMNGDQFNQYLAWIGYTNDSQTYYNPWFVCYSFPDQIFLPSYECFQWVKSSLFHIQLLGGTIAPGVTSFYNSIAALYTKEMPKEVDLYDPTWTNDILDFYELLEENWNNLGVIGFFEELIRIAIDDQIFVYMDDSYYLVTLDSPYFEMHWTQLPIPILSKPHIQ